LPIAPSQYYEAKRRVREPERRPRRVKRDVQLKGEIQRIPAESDEIYGARKVWKQLGREQWEAPRCAVERLMRELGLKGVRRGRLWKTTVPDLIAARPLDRVDRQFVADHPNQLWVADFTCVPTWQGMVFVAFILDVYARRIIGWRVAKNMRTALVLDALEQAIWARSAPVGVVHHSDRGGHSLYHHFCLHALVCLVVSVIGAATHALKRWLHRILGLCLDPGVSSAPRRVTR